MKATADFIAVSDGAGGGGIYADKWSAYLVDKLPTQPILTFAKLDAWIEAFNSAREKNCSLRRAAVIHVDIFPTDPSTFGLSLGFRTLAGRMARL